MKDKVLFVAILGLAITGVSFAIADPFDLPLVFAQVTNSTSTNSTSTITNSTIIEQPLTFPDTEIPLTIEPEFQKILLQQNQDSKIYKIDDKGTYQFVSHFPYFETEDGEFIPYRLVETNDIIQVEVFEGKFIFDKNTGGVTTFVNGTETIQSDSYIVRSAELNTDNWFDLDVNQSPVTVFVSETNEEDLTITVRRQNNEGTFDIDYKLTLTNLKGTAKFTNLIYPNHKFAFTETLNLVNPIIILNEQEIDIRNYIGQIFPREILEQNRDLILQIQDMYYNSGLGFDNLWSVGIFDDNKIALDYANVEQTQTQIGQTVELDPTYTISSPMRNTNGSYSLESDSQTNGVSTCTNTYLSRSSDSKIFKSIVSWSDRCQAGIFSFSTGAFKTYLTGLGLTTDSITSVKFGQMWGVSTSTGLSQTTDLWVFSNGNSYADSTLWQYANQGTYDGASPTTAVSQVWDNATPYSGTGLVYYVVPSNTLPTFKDAVDNSYNLKLLWFFDTNTRVSSKAELSASTSGSSTLEFTFVNPPADPPTNLSTTQIAGNQFSLSWTAPASGTTPTGYKVERSVDNTTWTVATSDTGSTNTSYTDTFTPEPNTTLYYRVFSYEANDLQYSLTSVSDSLTTWDYPNPPTNVQTVDGIPLNVSWTAPSPVDGTISGYKVYRSTFGSHGTQLPNNGGTTPIDFTDNELLLHGESFYGVNRDSTYDGTNNGAITGVTGIIDNAWNFDGSNDYVGITQQPVQDDSDYSASVWVKFDTLQTGAFIDMTDDDYEQEDFQIWYRSGSNDLRCDKRSDNTTSNINVLQSTTTPSIGQWYHIVCVYDDSVANDQASFPQGAYKMYINGVLEDDTTITGADGSRVKGVNQVWIGDFDGTNYFDGQIDQILIYNKALTSAEVSALYNSGSGTSTPDTNGLTTHYNFEQTGTTLENQVFLSQATPDNSPNSLTVTANSGTTTTGQISNAISTPNLEVTSSLLPDATDSFTVGSWVKQTATPTNTKLFGFTNSNGDDVVFNVGTTTADFSKSSLQATSYSTSTQATWGTTNTVISGINVVGSGANWGNYAVSDESVYGRSFSVEFTVSTSTQTMFGLSRGTHSSTTAYEQCEYCFYIISDGRNYTFEHGENQPNTVFQSHGTIGASGTYRIDVDSLGNVSYYRNNILLRSTSSFPISTTDTHNIVVYPFNTSSVSSKILSGSYQGQVLTSIISATGLTDNTSDYQQYALTRDGSSWTLYQNGASVATATDSTDLGTVSGSHKINLDGSIDEYFIDSTALTSNEIETIYNLGGDPTFLSTTGTTPSYNDNSGTIGQSYYYYVKTTTDVGDSQTYSTPALGTYGTPPDPPTGLSATIQNTATAPRDIFLQWSAPTNVGSGTLTGFEIWRDGSLVTTVGLVSSYVDIVPTAGTYTYTVKAVSTHGTSVDSNSAQITTPNVPDAPQGLTLSIDNPDPSPLTVTVTVSPPLNDGGSAVGSYNIYTSTDDITYTLQASNVSNPSNITVPSAGLWYFKASAVNGVGEGALSSSNFIGTPNVPSAVDDLAFTSSTPTTLTVNWTAPDNGGSAITLYKMFVDGVQVDTTTFTTYTFTGLTTKTNYDFTVVTTNNVGDSNSSNTLNETVWGVPDAVTNLTTSSTLSSITINYDAAVPYGYPVTGYKLERESPVGGGFTVLSTNIGIVTTYTDTGLSPVVEYNYRITPLSSIGDGVSATINYTTLPPAPTGLTASSTITGNMDLSWTSPSPSTGVTGYHIQRADGVGNAYATIVADTGNTNTTYTDTGLTQGIVYVYRVAEITSFGESNYSNTYSMTTYYLPNAVTDLTVTTNNLLQFVLNWSQPTLYGTLTGYQLNYTTPAGVPQTIYSNSIQDTNTKISGFDPTVEFSFRVAPITIHGTNATGNIVTAQVTSQIEIGDISVSGQATPDTRDIVFSMETLDNNTNVITATFDPALELNCEISQPALGTTQDYPSISETLDGADAYHEFTINNSAGNIVEIDCHDTTDNTISASYTLRTDEIGNNTTDSIISIQQIKDFTDGTLGGSDSIGGVSLIILAVGIIGMIGFNRTHPAIGIGMFVVVMGGARYFNLIGDVEGVIGIIALLIVLAVAGAERISR